MSKEFDRYKKEVNRRNGNDRYNTEDDPIDQWIKEHARITKAFLEAMAKEIIIPQKEIDRVGKELAGVAAKELNKIFKK